MTPSISVILPVFNESDKLETSVFRLRMYLDSLNTEYEIIIAEDGSTDGSDKIAKRLAERDVIIHIHSDERLGRGGALKRAGKLVRGEYIIYMDADLATESRYIGIMIKHLRRYKIVIGSRYHNHSNASRSVKRLFLSRIYHSIVRIMFPSLRLSDTECGFKGFRRGVFLSINRQVRNNGWSWDLEFLARAKRRGLKIKEIPITWKEGRTTTVNIIRDSLSQFLEIFRIKALLFSLPCNTQSHAKGSSRF